MVSDCKIWKTKWNFFRLYSFSYTHIYNQKFFKFRIKNGWTGRWGTHIVNDTKKICKSASLRINLKINPWTIFNKQFRLRAMVQNGSLSNHSELNPLFLLFTTPPNALRLTSQASFFKIGPLKIFFLSYTFSAIVRYFCIIFTKFLYLGYYSKFLLSAK